MAPPKFIVNLFYLSTKAKLAVLGSVIVVVAVAIIVPSVEMSLPDVPPTEKTPGEALDQSTLR